MQGTARKRTRRKDARPAEILDAGLAEFGEKGFAGARLEDVARRAGIAKGTIYLYYGSKEALFEAAVRDRLVATIDDLSATAGRFEGSTEALLSTLLGRIYDELVGTDSIVLLKVLVAEGNRFPSLVALYREVALARGMALVSAIVARGVARGEIRPGPAAGDPRIVMAPTIAAAIWTILFGREAPLDREAFLAAHLDLLANGLLDRRRET